MVYWFSVWLGFCLCLFTFRLVWFATAFDLLCVGWVGAAWIGLFRLFYVFFVCWVV